MYLWWGPYQCSDSDFYFFLSLFSKFFFSQTQDCMISGNCHIVHEPFISVILLGQGLRYPRSQLLPSLPRIDSGKEILLFWSHKAKGSQDRLGALEIFENSPSGPVFSMRERGPAFWGGAWQLLRTASHLLLAVVLSNAGTQQPFILLFCTFITAFAKSCLTASRHLPFMDAINWDGAKLWKTSASKCNTRGLS